MTPEYRNWLPSRPTSIHVAVVCAVTAAFWFVLFVATEPDHQSQNISFAGLAVYAGGSLLSGAAFGCFYGAVLVAANGLLNRASSKVKAFESGPRAIRVPFTFWLAHVGFVGTLAFFGMWKQPWPWFFGVLPFLWQ